MVLKEDIIPLVGGLDFDVISPDVKKQIAVATRKLFHKTPESRKRGLMMLTTLRKSVPVETMKVEIDKTAKDYAETFPSKAVGVIGGTLLAYKTLQLVANHVIIPLIDRYNYAQERTMKILKSGVVRRNDPSSPFTDYWVLMNYFFTKGRAIEAPRYDLGQLLDYHYGQTPAWKWMKHGKIVPSGVQRKPSSFVRTLPLAMAGALGAAAMKGYGRRVPTTDIPPAPAPPPLQFRYISDQETRDNLQYLNNLFRLN